MLREKLMSGLMIPAHPLALNENRKLDERRQRALTRYYLAAGAGGLAVAVHTTQFGIRDPGIDLLRPVLELAQAEMCGGHAVSIAGVCGRTRQAMEETELAASLGYEAVLLSLSGLTEASVEELIEHTRVIASVRPVVGFYLQSAVGGRALPYEFWRRFVEIENVVAIKIAPFNRYQTLDVVRAVADAGRGSEIALYTGNDDNIVLDLLAQYRFGGNKIRIVGGLLGHWAAWTRPAVYLFERIKRVAGTCEPFPDDFLAIAQQVTDMNAALFDPANNFRGCIAGVNEVLRRQGLLRGNWCLNPEENLSGGQAEEIDRVCAAYPHLTDDEFVREHIDQWLS